MADAIWRGTAQARAQVWKGTITTTTVGHVYEVSLADQDRYGIVEMFEFELTAAHSTVTLAAEGFVAQWNADPRPNISGITASNVAGVITLTADVAGQPFVAAADGSGTWADDGNTVESSGPNDWNIPANWVNNILPSSGDVLYFPPGASALLYGLDNVGDSYSLRVLDGASYAIGRYYGDELIPLSATFTAVDIRGSGMVAIDMRASAIVPVVDHGGSLANGRAPVNIMGSAMTGFDVRAGGVGFGVVPGLDAVFASSSNLRQAGGQVMLGYKATVGASSTWTKSGGDAVAYVNVPTVVQRKSGTYRQEAGAWTTMTAHAGDIYPNSGTIYNSTTWYGTARVIADESAVAKTFTSSVGDRSRLFDPSVSVTLSSHTQIGGGSSAPPTGIA